MFISVRMAAYLFLLALSASSLFTAQADIEPETDVVSSTCSPEWQVDPGPAGEYARPLYAVDGVSGSDVWAIGYQYSGGGSIQPAMVHWDGSQWSILLGGIANWHNMLSSVSAISSNDVWAVGSHGCEELCELQLLIEHWNGNQWGVVSGPNIPMHRSMLSGVVGIASNDVWAVGWYFPVDGPPGILIVHWDGSQWNVVPGPDLPNTSSEELSAIDAVSANDIWAVGNYPRPGTGENSSLVAHWDGTSWTLSSSPDVGRITGVKALSANDVWAVGRSAFLHWNGTTWTEVPYPTSTAPRAIDGTSANDVWAVGNGIALHWDGSAWTEVPGPNGYHGNLLDVYAAAADNVWAVGGGNAEGEWGLEHYSPVPCPPPCPNERFTDVCPTDYFYQHVLDLNDLGILSGYSTAPPCDGPGHIPCFKPYNWSTRGQIAKVVSLSAGFNEPVTTQSFEDVPPAHTFYQYIERMASRGIIVGYPCGGPGEPCIAPDNLPYFRPGATVNRAQLSKMTALSFGFQDPASGQTFEDVVPENHFYPFIENLASRNIINGYACGGQGEPCIPPGNRPYFRYGNPITRGQVAKILNLARIQSIPTTTPVPTGTTTPTFTPTLGPLTVTPPVTSTATATATATPEATSTPGASRN